MYSRIKNYKFTQSIYALFFVFTVEFYILTFSQIEFGFASNSPSSTHDISQKRGVHSELSNKVIRDTVLSFLTNIPLIRVPVVQAPGLGHQSAAVTVVTRLRQLGYQGHIQVVYENSAVAEKLTRLMPPFNYSKTDAQSIAEFPELNLSFISLHKLSHDHVYRSFGNSAFAKVASGRSCCRVAKQTPAQPIAVE